MKNTLPKRSSRKFKNPAASTQNAFNIQEQMQMQPASERNVSDYRIITINGWQLAKMKKSIPDMSLPWNL